MTTQPRDAGGSQAGTLASDIRRLWNEQPRLEQRARINGMHAQCCLEAGQRAWEQAKQAHDAISPEMRVDLPSPKVFARVLGLLRCVAALKYRPIHELELSAQDIADAIGYCKSTVEAALRWLSDDAIVWNGIQVSRGLGFITRVRRGGMAVLKGVYQKVYRTSVTALTMVGRALVGLLDLEERRNGKKAPSSSEFKGTKAKNKAVPQRQNYSPRQDLWPDAPDTPQTADKWCSTIRTMLKI